MDEQWAVVEIMGHRQRAGRVSEEEMLGTKMLRIDIPVDDEAEFVTERYGGSAIFCIRPATEEVARAMAKRMGDIRPANPMTYLPYHEPLEAEFAEVDEED